MKNKIRNTIIVFLGVILLTSAGYSQNLLRINDDIGGGGNGSSNQGDSSSDNTALYVVGGLIVVGIIAYTLISKKNKKNEEDKSDTSSALLQFSGADLASGFDDFEHEYKKVQDKIPVNLILGIRNEKAFVSNKIYLMGVSVRF